jgi:hypothetical protein
MTPTGISEGAKIVREIRSAKRRKTPPVRAENRKAAGDPVRLST